MGVLIHLIGIVCMIVGAVFLLLTFTEENDGTKVTARAVRAVAFLLLAGLLNGFG